MFAIPLNTIAVLAAVTIWNDPSQSRTLFVVPASFAIPADAPPTGRLCPTPVVWRLRARAAQPGADYDTTFVVPVFEVSDRPPAPPQANPHAAAVATSFSHLASGDD